MRKIIAVILFISNLQAIECNQADIHEWNIFDFIDGERVVFSDTTDGTVVAISESVLELYLTCTDSNNTKKEENEK